MAVTKEQKAQIISELAGKFEKSKSVVFAGSCGVNVKDISAFRSGLKKEDAEYMIAKKTLIKLAAEKAGIANLDEKSFEGPIGVVFGYEDEIAPARLAAKFSKENKAFAITGGVFNKEGIDKSYVDRLSSIPSRDVLLSKLVGTMNAPVSGFVGVLNAIPSGFVRILSALAKK